METVASEEMDVSMAQFVAEDAGEEVDKLEEYTSEEVVEESAAHMKM